MQNDNENASANYTQTPNANVNPQVNQIPVQPQNQSQDQQVKQLSNPSVSLPTSQPEKRNPYKLLIFGLILLWIAIGLAVISFVLRNRKPEGDILKATPVQKAGENITKIPPSPTPNPVENWDAYVTSDFLVKYPQNAILDHYKDGTLNLSVQGPTQTGATELFDGFAITFQPKSTSDAPEDFVEKLINETENSGVGKITKNPEPYTLNNYEGVGYVEEGLGTYQHILIGSDNNKRLILISILVADPGNQGFQDTVDQILSTFEFIPGI